MSQKVKIADIKPDTFMVLLRYIFIGKIFPVSLKNLFELVKAARALSVNDVTRRCSEILSKRKLFANLVHEWRYITLSRSRSSINIQELFDNSYFLTSSRSVTLFYVCENKHLQVKQETDVCDLIVAWLGKYPQLNDDESKVLGAVLQCIRWSSVPEKYVRSKLLHNENIIRSSGVEFIKKLLDLNYPSGIHFEMQRTFIRPSLGHEKVFMSIEKDKHDNYNVSMKRIQELACPSYLEVPSEYTIEPQDSMSCAVYHKYTEGSDGWQHDSLYLTGTGNKFIGITKYEVSTGWSECSDMIFPRQHHCSVFVGETLFTCGGVARFTIESFDMENNKSYARNGKLMLFVTNPACVAYQESIYIFGDVKDNNKFSDRVQRYDTVTDTVQLYEQRMSRRLTRLSPVVSGNLIILFHQRTCLVYDVTNQSWRVKEQCRTNIAHFAAVLEDNKIFIFGGIDGKKSPQGGAAVDDHVDQATVRHVLKTFSGILNPTQNRSNGTGLGRWSRQRLDISHMGH